MKRSQNYKEDLLKSLQDDIEAKEYLNAALSDGNLEVFLLALQDVIEAKTIKQNLQNTTVNSENIGKTFFSEKNPSITTLVNILNNLGYRLMIDS